MGHLLHSFRHALAPGLLGPFAVGALTFGALASAPQVEPLTLEQMVQRVDNGVFGRIVSRNVRRIDHPTHGPELYFTTLTIEGTTLTKGREIRVEVTYPGGFIDEEHGVHNSEAPAEEETAIGNTVVAFYTWTEDMGGGLAANMLEGSHAGLYTTFVTRKGRTIVQGRGQGYAIDANVELADLETAVGGLSKQKDSRRERR